MDKRKRILFLLHLPPPVHGSSMVGMTIKDSIPLNNKFDCHYINLLASRNVADVGKISAGKIFGFVITYAKVLKSILQHRPELCYLALTTTGSAFFKDFFIIILLKLFRIKLIYHLHNKGIKFCQRKFLYRICYRFAFHKAEVIILSKHLYSDVRDFVPESKIHICPNGIQDNEQFCTDYQQIRRQENGLDGVAKILFLSNLIETKGVFVLLDAMRLMKKRRVKFECSFIGGEKDISASELNRRIEELGLADFVSYKGMKYGQDKQIAFLNADIFALPTYYSKECFPLVLLEAMSYSLPIISTFEGGIPDIVEDGINGFVVQQTLAEPLAEKLEILISNETLRRKMGAAGRKSYQEKFTVDRFEINLSRILEDSIKN